MADTNERAVDDKATQRVMDKVIVIGMSKKQEEAFRGGLERRLTQRPAR